MEDVLCVPKLRENLLSTTMLMLKGYPVIQKRNTIAIYDQKGSHILTGKLYNNQAKFIVKPCVNNNTECSSFNVEQITYT